MILPAVLMLAGGLSLSRRCWAAATLLMLPIALAMIASALQRYPFHGRLILELVPAFFILIAEGTEMIYRIDPRPTKLGYKAAPGSAADLSVSDGNLPVDGKSPSRFQPAWRLARQPVHEVAHRKKLPRLWTTAVGFRISIQGAD